MISSEMPELLGITDRILVMSNGRVAGIVETEKNRPARNYAFGSFVFVIRGYTS